MERTGGMETESRACVLAIVLAAVERGGHRFDESLAPELIDSWVEREDVFCVMYRQPLYGPMVLGLRRTVEPDWTVEGVADEVITCELDEPLGSMADTLQADEAGVMWWTGNLPEWKERRGGKRTAG